MATVNFSVPENLKRKFNRAFSGSNKSAVIASLMERAVEERALALRRKEIAHRLLALRGRSQAVTDAEIRNARRKGRP